MAGIQNRSDDLDEQGAVKMLKAEHIVHRYGKETVLHGIDIEIPKESFTVITGESGSGKSTLLSILSTLLHPDEGSVSYDGQAVNDIKDIDRFRNEVVGFVFQFHYLIPHMSVYENIAMVTRKGREEIMMLLSELGIDALAKKYPDQISGGQRQRAAIARALINDPDYLFADELTGNLDSANSDKVFALLRNTGTTVIVATHDLSRIDPTDRVINLKDGSIC